MCALFSLQQSVLLLAIQTVMGVSIGTMWLSAHKTSLLLGSMSSMLEVSGVCVCVCVVVYLCDGGWE